MNILLTGAGGFVGQQVLNSLLQTDNNISLVLRTGADLTPYKREPNIKSIISSPDIFTENQQWWMDTLQKVELVIHVAWFAEPGKYLQSEKNLECLKGTMTLAQAAVATSVKRFVGIGTCFEYDLSGGYLTTKTPLSPSTPYAAAKASVYSTLSQWLSQENVAFCWCRLFYLYGENEDRHRLVPYLRSKLAAGKVAELTSGKQIRDFLDVKHAGEMITRTALSETQGAVNICSGVPITVRQLAEEIAAEYNRQDLLRFGVRPENLTDPPCVVGIK